METTWALYALDLLSDRESLAEDGLSEAEAERLARARNLAAHQRGIPTVWHARPHRP